MVFYNEQLCLVTVSVILYLLRFSQVAYFNRDPLLPPHTQRHSPKSCSSSRFYRTNEPANFIIPTYTRVPLVEEALYNLLPGLFTLIAAKAASKQLIMPLERSSGPRVRITFIARKVSGKVPTFGIYCHYWCNKNQPLW